MRGILALAALVMGLSNVTACVGGTDEEEPVAEAQQHNDWGAIGGGIVGAGIAIGLDAPEAMGPAWDIGSRFGDRLTGPNAPPPSTPAPAPSMSCNCNCNNVH